MYIYAIGTDTKQKIGFSKEPTARLKQLQTGNPEQIVLHHCIEVDETRIRLLERFLHKDIGYKRIKGEWFNMTKNEAVNYLIFAEITWVNDPLLEYKL
jgi:hypothetical protein